MKNILTPYAPGGSPRQAFSINSIAFLQQAYTEAINSILLKDCPNTGGACVVNGVFNLGNTTNYDVTAGSIFYNGQLYQVAATGLLTPGSGQTAVCVIEATPDANADPCQFDNGNTQNVHINNTIKIQAGAPGSGICDFANLNYQDGYQIGDIKMYQGDISPASFDSTGLGVSSSTRGWALCNNQNGAIDLRGKFIVGYYPGGDGDGDYNTLTAGTAGVKNVTLSATQSGIRNHQHNFTTYQNTGSPGATIQNGGSTVYESGGVTDAVIGGNQNAIDWHENRPPYYTLAFIQKVR